MRRLHLHLRPHDLEPVAYRHASVGQDIASARQYQIAKRDPSTEKRLADPFGTHLSLVISARRY